MTFGRGTLSKIPEQAMLLIVSATKIKVTFIRIK